MKSNIPCITQVSKKSKCQQKKCQMLFDGFKTDSHVFHLGIGQHTFPFTFILPMQIPSSFEGEYGHVRYVIRASAQLPCHQSEYKCKTILVVCSSLDLNTIPRAAVTNNY